MPTLETALQRSLFALISMPNSDMPKTSAAHDDNALDTNSIYEYMKVHNASGTLRSEDIGQLYEAELAKIDKVQKKHSGQYYTPNDVACLMSKWLSRLDGRNICDVACGTGNLIMAYLDYIGREQAIELLQNDRLYLYDTDGAALGICKAAIMLKYGEDAGGGCHIIHADFLNSSVHLPNDCKVIANPPYCAISNVGNDWDDTEVLHETRELYALFMEKIIKQSVSSVIITPYSFISSPKFYALRKVMSTHGGAIFAFDNIPGNIFCGKKHGVFNTNMMNSVRSAITVTSGGDEAGYRVTPLIRFKRSEREALLKCDVLEGFLGSNRQVITGENTRFVKCFKILETVYDKWFMVSSGHTLGESVRNAAKYALYMPNTCRYFTAASVTPLHRGGQIALYFDDEVARDYAYCMLNSSFAYWWWRLFDGGITYTRGLLLNMPSILSAASDDDKAFFHAMQEEMTVKARGFIVTKSNVGVQENIKFPREYRDRINDRMLGIIDISAGSTHRLTDVNSSVFDMVHSNAALEVSV